MKQKVQIFQEKLCSFCKKTTILPIRNQANFTEESIEDRGTTEVVSLKTNNTSKTSKKIIDVYSNAKEVFSLHNQNNTIASTIKEQPKLIKNNKKKKDKFAGLCQKAVIASAKIKEERDKQKKCQNQDKLSLFLKASS